MSEKTTNEKLIHFPLLIARAKKAGVDFGKGNPYNRLRYYTKIGLLPHAKRKSYLGGDPAGVYPESVLNTLVEIDRKLKTGQSVQAILREQKILDNRSDLSDTQNLAPNIPHLTLMPVLTARPERPSLQIEDVGSKILDSSKDQASKVVTNQEHETIVSLKDADREAIYNENPTSNIQHPTSSLHWLYRGFNENKGLIPSLSVLLFLLLPTLLLGYQQFFAPKEAVNLPSLTSLTSLLARNEAGSVLAAASNGYINLNAETDVNALLHAKEGVGFSSDSFEGVLDVGSLTADRSYSLPDSDGTLCLTTGNCAQAGGGVTITNLGTGDGEGDSDALVGGTIGQLAKFTGTQSIGDSIISDNGSLVTVSGNLAVTSLAAATNSFICRNGATLSSCTISPGSLSADSSLTDGSVLFAKAGLVSQNNSKFFWNDTNFSLGLGTTAPSASLDIRYSGGSTAGFNLSGFSYNHLISETSSLANISFTDSTSTDNITTTTNGLLISPDINTSTGAATRTINGISVNPTFTDCSSGTCSVNGLNIGSVTANTGFTGNGINIGTGWDNGVKISDVSNQKGVDIQAPSLTTGYGLNISSAPASPIDATAGDGISTGRLFSADQSATYTNGNIISPTLFSVSRDLGASSGPPVQIQQDPCTPGPCYAKGGVSTLSWTHTVGSGTNRLLLVGISFGFDTTQSVSSIIFCPTSSSCGTSLTRLGTATNSGATKVELWYLKNPPSGQRLITATMSAGLLVVGGSTSWSNVCQTTCNSVGTFGTTYTNTGNSTAPTINGITSDGTQIVHDVVGVQTGTSVLSGPGGSQTQQWNQKHVQSGLQTVTISGGGSVAPGGTNSMSWSITPSSPVRYWAQLAVPINSINPGGTDTVTVNGHLAQFVANCSRGGLCDGTGDILLLSQNSSNSTGSVLTIGNNGTGASIMLPAKTNISGGISFGGDTSLYRSAAGVLKTDTSFAIGNTTLSTLASSARAVSFPDAAGTVCLTSNCIASGATLFTLSDGTNTSTIVQNDILSTLGGNGITTAVASDSSTISLGTLSSDWDQTGTGDIILNNASSNLQIREDGGGSDLGTFNVASITGNQTYNFTTGGTVWTSGNDGAASTLDADLLDGISSASFLRVDQSDSFDSGTLTIADGTTLTVNSSTINFGNSATDTITVNSADIIFEKGANDLTFAVTAPSGASRTATVPALGADDTFCFVTLGNCAGTGSGVTTGGGTANYLAKFTAGQNIENSQIFDNGTNVGINTTGPDRRFDILDASNPQLRLTQTDATNYVDFQVDSSGNLTITPSGTSSTISTSLALSGTSLTTSQTSFNLLNATATTINFAGAATTFAIGPAGASGSINFSGGSGDTGCTINGVTGDLTCSGNIGGSGSGSVGYWSRSGTTLSPSTSNDIISITSSTGVPLTLTNTSSGNSFLVNDASSDTTPFVIDTSGNVGVGTSTPGAKLDVIGSIDFATYKKLITVVEGDSISDTDFDPSNWSEQFTTTRSSYFGKSTVTNYALFGDTAASMVSQYATEAYTKRPVNNGDEAWFFIMAGSNDIFLGDSAATVYNNLKTIWASARADRFKVVAFTVLPRTDFTVGNGKETIRQSLNTLILSDPSLYDFVVQADVTIPDPSSGDYSDGIHPSSTGSRKIADIAETTISYDPWLLLPTTTATTPTNMSLILNPTGGKIGFGTSSPSASFDIGANSVTTGTIEGISATGLTSGKVLSLALGSALTSGNALSVTGASYNPGFGGTGNLIDLNFTNASNNTSFTSTVTALNIAGTLTASGTGGTHETYGIMIQSLAGSPTGNGTQNNYGIRIGNQGKANTEAAYGLYINAQTGSTGNSSIYSAGGSIDFLVSPFNGDDIVFAPASTNSTNGYSLFSLDLSGDRFGASATDEHALELNIMAEGFNNTDDSALHLNFLSTTVGTKTYKAGVELTTSETTGDTVLTDALKIGAGSGTVITNAINLTGTGIVTDILLQNSESIDNDTDGTIALTANFVDISGNLAVGASGAVASNIGVNSESLATTGANCLFGCYSVSGHLIVDNNATNPSYGIGLAGRVETTANSFTLTGAYALAALAATQGSGSAITNAIGLYIQPQTVGTNGYGICFDCDTSFETNTVASGIQWGNDSTTSQNLRIYRSNTSSAANLIIEDSAGTDLINATATTFRINLSAQTSSGQRICQDGSDGSTGVETIGDCDSGGADIAEYYGSDGTLEGGDLVIPSEHEAFEFIKTTGLLTSKAFVTKSSQESNNKVIGVVSTSPFGEVLGEGVFDPMEHPVPIALVGRAPVKVSTENGVINVGDPLTSSSIPGVAMKAAQSGPIVGKALASYGHTDPTAVGKIIVFVHTSWYVAPISEVESQNSELKDLTALNTQTLTSNTIRTEILFVGDKKIAVTGEGELAIDGSVLVANNLLVGGSIEAKEIKAEKFNVASNSAQPNEISNSSAGKATLTAGSTELVITTSRVTDGSLIFVTPSTKTDKVLSVTQKQAGQSFKVEVTDPALTDIEFSWWIVN